MEKPRVKVAVKIDAPGLLSAEAILAQELAGAGKVVGGEGVKRVQRLQRKDTGEEQRRTRYKVVNRKTQLNVELYNTSIQGAIDETGAKPHFPPFKAGSSLFRWVSRKGLAMRPGRGLRQAAASAFRARTSELNLSRQERTIGGRVAANRAAANAVKRIEGISFAIAKAQSRRGLPRPGDPLRRPFETVSKPFGAYSTRVFDGAARKATARINRGK